ncbi:hypothetical protein MXB_2554, partial [Myxobolus squamalis]
MIEGHNSVCHACIHFKLQKVIKLYCTILHELVVLFKYTWMPSTITVDFKEGLVNACNHEFPESKMIKCFFDLKQALHRNLKRLYLNQPK